MRNPCKNCIYDQKENKICQPKECALIVLKKYLGLADYLALRARWTKHK